VRHTFTTENLFSHVCSSRTLFPLLVLIRGSSSERREAHRAMQGEMMRGRGERTGHTKQERTKQVESERDIIQRGQDSCASLSPPYSLILLFSLLRRDSKTMKREWNKKASTHLVSCLSLYSSCVLQLRREKLRRS